MAIYRRAGYGLEHRVATLLENPSNLLHTAPLQQTVASAHPSISHVAHHRSRDLMLLGTRATKLALGRTLTPLGSGEGMV